jgi:hypothetical protein
MRIFAKFVENVNNKDGRRNEKARNERTKVRVKEGETKTSLIPYDLFNNCSSFFGLYTGLHTCSEDLAYMSLLGRHRTCIDKYG